MSKVKKYIIFVIVMFVGLVFCNISSVHAAGLLELPSRGSIRTWTGSVLKTYKNVLCIDHTAPLGSSTRYTFTCKNRITIEGNVSTGKKGSNDAQEYTNEANGTLAYLLSSYRTQVDYSGAHARDAVQQDMWRYISTWKNAVGKQYDGLNSMSMTGANYNGGSSNRITAAKNYAKNISKIEEGQTKLIEDKTDKENVKTKIITLNDKEYARIGPFKYEFSGSLKRESLSVTNAEGNSINVLFMRYDADKNPIYGIENIKSNKNFYILIKANKCSEVNGKIKIHAKKEYEIKKVTICFMSVSYAQNLVVYSNSTSKKEQEFDYEYDVKMFGNLNVIKVDKADNKVKLPNVGFKIKYVDTGKWIKETSDGIEYVDSKESASEFKTGTSGDKLGKLTINNLLVGTYEAYETKNPDSKYIIIQEGQKKEVEVNKTAELKIENERAKGNLKVIKVDKANNEIKLNGVEFIIKDNTTGKYVKRDSDGKISYVSKSKATKFKTGENGAPDGEILIEDLYVGTYTAYETKNPDSKYVMIRDGQEQEVKADKTEELKIENERYKGNLKVIKVDKSSNELKLNGVEFIIKDNTTGKYVKRDSNGKISYVSRNEATTFKTGENGAPDGEILIEDLYVGTYTAYETKNPDSKYTIIQDGQEQEVKVDKTEELKIYNERYKGNLKVIKVDKHKNELKLNGVEFIIKDNTTGKYVKRDNDGKISYVSKDDATTFKTGENGAPAGEILIEGLYVGTYTAYETKNPDSKYMMIKDGQEQEVKIDKTEELKIENERYRGNLKVIKVDEDNNEVKLNGVEFVIKFDDFNQYVKRDGEGNITYVDNEQDATIFKTGENGDPDGEINIQSLLVGTYTAYEKDNPDKHYEIITEGKQQDVTADKTVELKIQNKPVSIDLSGYVWIDENDAKGSLRNGLYKQDNPDDNYEDNSDILLDGITVRLIDRRTGKVVKNQNGRECIATTSKLDRYVSDGNDGHGEYFFEYIPLYDENDTLREDNILDQYYIEFEYDGMTYVNVVPHIDLNRGSKASEKTDERKTFNEKFTVIDGSNVDTSTDTGLVRIDGEGKTHADLTFTRNKNENGETLYTSTTQCKETFIMKSYTDEAGYNIKDHRVPGKNEIRYINLGIQRRRQPSNMMSKDLKNIELSINGHNHIYYYDQEKITEQELSRNQADLDKGEFNVGVKFEKWSQPDTYRRAVYEADINYTDEQNKSNELKAIMTYTIAVTNESGELKSRIQKIADYYDSNYKLISVMGRDQNGNEVAINGLTANEVEGYSANAGNGQSYKKAIVNIPDTYNMIDSQKQMVVYLKFELNREAILTIMNGNISLRNVAEILSYSTYDKDGNIYAGLDVKSAPGNADPTRKETAEDDTAMAPALKLELADAREITGKVFEDGTTVNANIRQGDGKYLDGEKGIANVKVTLKETDQNGNNKENGNVYETTTDANGDFVISGFVPGYYKLTYTWGNEIYPVQNYKATIYDKARYDTNNANKEWYKTDIDTRWTDATDNYETRTAIDGQMNTLPATIGDKIITMDSTTPLMDFSVEYDTTTTASTGDKYIYQIKNIDFGIAERPRQAISIEKKVTGVKVIAADKSELVNTQVVNGKLEGLNYSAIYLAPSLDSNGMLKLEIDNELIQGSNVIIDYAIIVANNSEKDYVSQDFYTYGIQSGEEVTLTPNGVYDYLDKELTAGGNEWVIKSAEEYSNEVGPLSIIEFRNKVSNSFTSTDTSTDGGTTSITTTEQYMSKEYQYYKMQQEQLATWKNEVITARNEGFRDKIILFNEQLTKPLKAGERNEVSLQASKVLSTSDEIDLNNEAEITNVTQNGGSIPNITSIVKELEKPSVYSKSETVVITNPTGENRDYTTIAIITISTLVVLGVGIVLIKKKILNK